MSTAKEKDENPRMKAADFDRIMREALQVSPPEAKKPKGTRKAKKAAKRKPKR
jgi:hypothetical protein